jgi:hypothetical protein
MSAVIKVKGAPISLVYVGNECLLVYSTNQRAWEHLSSLITVENGQDDWPQEVYLVLALCTPETIVGIPTIGQIVLDEADQGLSCTPRHKEVWGPDYDALHDKVISDWPQIKNSQEVKRLLKGELK